MNKALALVVLSTVPSLVSAQVVTPVPPKTAPAPAWTPPVAPPPLPPPPPEAPVATPDIVKRDKDGFVIWPDRPYELLVLEAIPMDEAQKKTWREKWTARQAQMDDLLVRNASEAIAFREALSKIDEAKEWGPVVNMATPLNKYFALQPMLDQFIKSSQVLNGKQLGAYADGVKNFKSQSTESLLKKVGNDNAKLMIEKPREAAKERAQEGTIAFDRMAADLAANWTKAKAALNLSGDFGAAEAMAAKATDETSRAAAGLALLKAIPAERQSEVLGTFRTPMPPPPKPPVDPAVQGADLPKVPATPPATPVNK
jgi:hypothetical protein